MTTDASAAGEATPGGATQGGATPGGATQGAGTHEGAEGRVYNVGGEDWDEVVRAAQEAGDKTDTERMVVNMGGGSSDGIRCDVDGNVWSAAGWGNEAFNGVHVFAPDATLIGKIHLPETCANLCFGGAKKNRLFMAASQSLYAVYVGTEAALVP